MEDDRFFLRIELSAMIQRLAERMKQQFPPVLRHRSARMHVDESASIHRIADPFVCAFASRPGASSAGGLFEDGKLSSR